MVGDVVPASRANVWHTLRLHRRSLNCCIVLNTDHGSDDANKEVDYDSDAQKRMETKKPENQIQAMEQHIGSYEQVRSKKGAASFVSTMMWIGQVHYDHCVNRLSRNEGGHPTGEAPTPRVDFVRVIFGDVGKEHFRPKSRMQIREHETKLTKTGHKHIHTRWFGRSKFQKCNLAPEESKMESTQLSMSISQSDLAGVSTLRSQGRMLAASDLAEVSTPSSQRRMLPAPDLKDEVTDGGWNSEDQGEGKNVYRSVYAIKT